MFDHDSKISYHVREHNHIKDFEGVRVVGHETIFHKRLFLEAWFSIKDSHSGNDHIAIPEVYVSGTRQSLALRYQETSREFFLSAPPTYCF